ncbi:hypothetical protein AB1L88_26730 [Tautonia sp. JC769]|uniref:hypothetical protein n=1 Tax=Tautonia sp. JC769 TaxID=3232135 RepID=UPI0034599787
MRQNHSIWAVSLLIGCWAWIGLDRQLLPAAAACDHPESVDQGRREQASKVCEMIFRHQFKRDIPDSLLRDAQAIFLSIEKQDPSPEFMKRFAKGQKLPVRPGSEFKEGVGPWLRIDDLEWSDKEAVVVQASIYVGPVAAEWRRFRLVRRECHWVIVEDKLIGVS